MYKQETLINELVTNSA